MHLTFGLTYCFITDGNYKECYAYSMYGTAQKKKTQKSKHFVDDYENTVEKITL